MKKFLVIVVLIFCANTTYGQFGMWTWMNGDDTIHSDGNFGTLGVPSILNSPPSLYEPCEWKDQQGNFWLFGGFHYGVVATNPIHGDQNNLWKYNPLTNEWTWIKGPGVGDDIGNYGVQGIPSPLNNPAARGWGTPTWVDNNNNLWIYSGDIGYDDLWKYDISTNEWTWMKGDTTPYPYQRVPPVYGTYQIPSPLNTPGTRSETSASWTDNFGNLWLFGGGSNDSVGNVLIFDDLWKYDISINQWTWMYGHNYANNTIGHYGIKGIASPLNIPPARLTYAKWKDPAGNFYIFGG
jgi:galactose oxidase-like protein